jgi:hypothetical protein
MLVFAPKRIIHQIQHAQAHLFLIRLISHSLLVVNVFKIAKISQIQVIL